jgi:hypothetical protein
MLSHFLVTFLGVGIGAIGLGGGAGIYGHFAAFTSHLMNADVMLKASAHVVPSEYHHIKLADGPSVIIQWTCCVAIWLYALMWAGLVKLPPYWEASGNCISTTLGLILVCLFITYTHSLYTWILFLIHFFLLKAFMKYSAKAGRAYVIGCFCAPIFMKPVQLASAAGMLKYDIASYCLGVGWSIGISNAGMYLLRHKGYISEWIRWKSQVFGWTILMSGIPIVVLLAGGDVDAYTKTDGTALRVDDMVRYSAFQLSVYLCTFEVCRYFEIYSEHKWPSGDRDVCSEDEDDVVGQYEAPLLAQ